MHKRLIINNHGIGSSDPPSKSVLVIIIMFHSHARLVENYYLATLGRDFNVSLLIVVMFTMRQYKNYCCFN